MNFSSYLTGSAIVVLATVTQPIFVSAYEATQVKEIADKITVRININDGADHGSGVIIARDDSNYYVLTARHVFDQINQGTEYTIVAPDGETHYVDNSTVEKVPNVDMAVVSFKSDRPYKVAQIERSRTRITPGIAIYINGFPKEAEEIEDGSQFTSGSLTGINEQTFDGYNLVYSNFTRGGMSGGPVLNEQGRLIGIHGLAAREKLPEQTCQAQESESNLGLPPQVGSATSQTDNQLPPQVGSTAEGASSNCNDSAIAQRSEKIDLNLGISIFTLLENVDAVGMNGILDTSALRTPERPKPIPSGTTTGTGCSGVVCP